MIIDENPRQSGKTTRMVMWARENSRRVILTFSYHRTMQIEREFPDMRGRVFDFEEYRRVRQVGQRHDAHEIGIDDLDIVLSIIFRFPIGRVSFSIAGVRQDMRHKLNPWYEKNYLPSLEKMVEVSFEEGFAPAFEGEKIGFKKNNQKSI